MSLRNVIGQSVFVGSEFQLAIIRQAARDWQWVQSEMAGMSAEELAEYWAEETAQAGTRTEEGDHEDCHPDALEALRGALVESARRAGAP